MKRKPVSTSRPSSTSPRRIDARRLTAVRGGDHLGIAVEVIAPPPQLMQMQHNDILIEL